MASSELVTLPAEDGKPVRFTSRDMLEAEKSLLKRVAAMITRRGHGLEPGEAPPYSLTEDQRRAFDYMVAEGDLKVLAASADGGKSAPLSAAREVWEAQGLNVTGIAVSRMGVKVPAIIVGNPGIHPDAQEREWQEGRDPWTAKHVVVVDEAEMIGLKQLERILAVADKARSKVVLLGDSRQLEAMGFNSPLRTILDRG